jgi:hypothetical protein
VDPSLPTPLADEALAALLAALGAAAEDAPGERVGRPEWLDRDERFGCWPPSDAAAAPAQLAIALRLFGFLPGVEAAAAAAKAGVASPPAAVACVDAPLRLQAAWAGRLAAGFAGVGGEDGARLRASLAAASAALDAAMPEEAAAWDAAVAAAASSLPPLEAAAAFRVSRACAAAALGPGALGAAAAAQATLQPLKARHTALREAHMAGRLRELCGEVARGGASGGGLRDVVLVLGRQHVAPLEAAWRDRSGPLWRERMPRTFSPSFVERDAAAAAAGGDPDVSSGGSRPVGQVGLDGL